MRLFKIEQRVYLFFRVNHYEAINKILLVKKKKRARLKFYGKYCTTGLHSKEMSRAPMPSEAKDNSIPQWGWKLQNIYKCTGKEEKIKYTRSREEEGSLVKISIYGNTESTGKTPMREFSADTFTSYSIWELKYATLSSHG